ncbi:DNA polymerase III subunit delta [Waterburya agarophytonicola K14]|uniref:DNA polymerase III subunit delta n=1 Tax=Waterburya agarophytonicola KI4 TaxID=2874699 RepID=A0A964FGJ4_9CYAN|nr:DNA polymerase III subunit delta [Waterburya agarophytonicola]MCC0176684.1 DNA polymerase III subunit delta [Waterburya agarophytonicola KI4]
MPIYLYWGEDDFEIAQAIEKLQNKVLDPSWLQFNYQKLDGDRTEAIIEGLNQAMTPVFGGGGRLTWLADTNLCQQKPADAIIDELKRTLEVIPDTSHLLLTTKKKPDGRLSSTKLFNKYAQVKDFSLIPPWKTDLIANKITEIAREIQLKLTPKAIALLTDSVGNNTRQIWNELAKLKIYRGESDKPLDETDVVGLVLCNTQNSLKLAAAIKDGKADQALGLVTDLINRNEPALKIVATLVGQFRTWTIVKLMEEAGERDNKAISSAAGINNPNRLYFIRKEIYQNTPQQLLSTLPLLLDLEYSLKTGSEALVILQTKIIELCLLF